MCRFAQDAPEQTLLEEEAADPGTSRSSVIDRPIMLWQTITLLWQKIRDYLTWYADQISGLKTCAPFKKPINVFIFICVVLFVLLIYYIKFLKVPWHFTSTPLRPTTPEKPVCKHNITEDTIIKIRNSNTFLISAYLDLRDSRMVRILGITYRSAPDSLLCDFCLIHYNFSNFAEHQVHSDHFGFPYGTTDLLCNIYDNRDPEYVSLYQAGDPAPVFLKIQNVNENVNEVEPKFQYNFLICISAMFGGYDNVLQFIQSMEMYRILGAEKVIIYYTDSSEQMKKILKYYIDLKFVELIFWPITSFINVSKGWHYPEHPGDLHYYGQTAALNDCIYRNMYKSKYIALNDVDELIIPNIHEDWPEMVDSLLKDDPNSSVFIFENHVFPTTPQDKANSITPEEWVSVPGVNILQHGYREPNLPSEINPTKMILNPRSVERVSVHVPLEFRGNEYKVPSDYAKLCHYREPKQKDLDKRFLIKDNILSKYEMKLIEKVNRVLSEVSDAQKKPSAPCGNSVIC